ncbi:hypothetical protein PIB30_016364 [Stylosanthes scabra]|uniref:Uncharacterized protein n=1 Tax=Stylosanthes scabra TaxID=79078 RepID=A0ABU6T726_9FABA|nr:hypothetical protein [Stylosanthes scabra]
MSSSPDFTVIDAVVTFVIPSLSPSRVRRLRGSDGRPPPPQVLVLQSSSTTNRVVPKVVLHHHSTRINPHSHCLNLLSLYLPSLRSFSLCFHHVCFV